MRKKIPKILVTGGAGFIGSAFLRVVFGFPTVIARRETRKQSHAGRVILVDKLTYAGDLKRLEKVRGRFKFYKTDICDKAGIQSIFQKEKPDIIVHFAAESHVDRSINDASPFIETNILGTQVLLDASRKFKIKKFIFISTDEVYGEIDNGRFTEKSPIRPSSPYAASKAAADLLVQSYIRTYNFPAIVIRPSNNYGPWQYPEKLIPMAIATLLRGGRVPLYARGENIREWLYVDDCAKGIMQIALRGRIGEIYNLGSGIESENIATVRLILKNLGVSQTRYKFVRDRPGHDIRYSLDSCKVKKELGWKPGVSLQAGIEYTVNWYLHNKSWLLGGFRKQ
jgi:dTDP-glucose 4,6-dehydratase